MIDTTELRRIVGGNVAQLREAKGWSQQQLAEKCGVRRPHISLIENGRVMASGELLFAMAYCFGVTVDSLGKIPVEAA